MRLVPLVHRRYEDIRHLTSSLVSFLKTKEGQAATGYEEETMNLMLGRWLKLQKDFYDARTDRFDLSKVGKRASCHLDSDAVRLHQV